jgi:hypothetical protein
MDELKLAGDQKVNHHEPTARSLMIWATLENRTQLWGSENGMVSGFGNLYIVHLEPSRMGGSFRYIGSAVPSAFRPSLLFPMILSYFAQTFCVPPSPLQFFSALSYFAWSSPFCLDVRHILFCPDISYFAQMSPILLRHLPFCSDISHFSWMSPILPRSLPLPSALSHFGQSIPVSLGSLSFHLDLAQISHFPHSFPHFQHEDMPDVLNSFSLNGNWHVQPLCLQEGQDWRRIWATSGECIPLGDFSNYTDKIDVHALVPS